MFLGKTWSLDDAFNLTTGQHKFCYQTKRKNNSRRAGNTKSSDPIPHLLWKAIKPGIFLRLYTLVFASEVFLDWVDTHMTTNQLSPF